LASAAPTPTAWGKPQHIGSSTYLQSASVVQLLSSVAWGEPPRQYSSYFMGSNGVGDPRGGGKLGVAAALAVGDVAATGGVLAATTGGG
jgi:hypothetical protein